MLDGRLWAEGHTTSSGKSMSLSSLSPPPMRMFLRTAALVDVKVGGGGRLRLGGWGAEQAA